MRLKKNNTSWFTWDKVESKTKFKGWAPVLVTCWAECIVVWGSKDKLMTKSNKLKKHNISLS